MRILRFLFGLLSIGLNLAAAQALRADHPDKEALIYDRLAPIELAGTFWVGNDGTLGRVTYQFERGGILRYTYPSGAEYRNGTWRQAGSLVYFEANNKYREFRGTLSGREISGKSWNVAGLNWETTFKPAPPAKGAQGKK